MKTLKLIIFFCSVLVASSTFAGTAWYGSSGMFVVPSGVNQILVEVAGGGGGGGASCFGWGLAGNGGPGGYQSGTFAVTSGTTLSVDIGWGGPGGCGGGGGGGGGAATVRGPGIYLWAGGGGGGVGTGGGCYTCGGWGGNGSATISW